MKEHGLLSEIRRKRKWVNLGQKACKCKNLLNCQFNANYPNSKWITDNSYIQTKEGILYLSMIRDLYDNSIVAYKTEAHQTVGIVLDTIRLAMKNEKKDGCGVAAPLRPGLSIHIPRIFQANTKVQHNSVNVKRGEPCTTMF